MSRSDELPGLIEQVQARQRVAHAELTARVDADRPLGDTSTFHVRRNETIRLMRELERRWPALAPPAA
jgi:hypothetical protein